MIPQMIFAFVLSLAVVCESSFVDTLVPCSTEDGKCLAFMIESALKAGSQGFPELDMEPIDPYLLKTNITIYNAVHMDFDGKVEGISKCLVKKFTPNIEAGSATLNLFCRQIKIKGHYDLKTVGKALEAFLRDGVSGDGKAKLLIDGLSLNIKFLFDVVKRGDKTYLVGKKDKTVISYDIEKMTFAASKILMGGVDSTESILALMNQNSKPLEDTTGKQIAELSTDIMHTLTLKFFDYISTDKFLIEDLSSYVIN